MSLSSSIFFRLVPGDERVRVFQVHVDLDDKGVGQDALLHPPPFDAKRKLLCEEDGLCNRQTIHLDQDAVAKAGNHRTNSHWKESRVSDQDPFFVELLVERIHQS